MKRKLLSIFIVAISIATLGMILDKDTEKYSLTQRGLEYFYMTLLIFVIASLLYFTIQLVFKKNKEISQ
jgi:uncharacterized transporter YbjL